MKNNHLIICFLLITSCQFLESVQLKFRGGNSTIVSENTLTVDRKCVIVMVPDSAKQHNLKKQYGEDGYNEVVADMNHYQYQAELFFDSLHIPLHYSSHKHIAFFCNKKLIKNICADSLQQETDLIYYNGKYQPIYANSAGDFITVAKNYFGINN